MNSVSTNPPDASDVAQYRRQLGQLQRDYVAWRQEHLRWLQDLKSWQQDQDRLEALLYKLEHILDEEEREFVTLLETIENQERLLSTHEQTIEFYLEGDSLESESLQNVVEAHRQQKDWQEKLRKLHDKLETLHADLMGDMQRLLNLRPTKPR